MLPSSIERSNAVSTSSESYSETTNVPKFPLLDLSIGKRSKKHCLYLLFSILMNGSGYEESAHKLKKEGNYTQFNGPYIICMSSLSHC